MIKKTLFTLLLVLNFAQFFTYALYTSDDLKNCNECTKRNYSFTRTMQLIHNDEAYDCFDRRDFISPYMIIIDVAEKARDCQNFSTRASFIKIHQLAKKFISQEETRSVFHRWEILAIMLNDYAILFIILLIMWCSNTSLTQHNPLGEDSRPKYKFNFFRSKIST